MHCVSLPPTIGTSRRRSRAMRHAPSTRSQRSPLPLATLADCRVYLPARPNSGSVRTSRPQGAAYEPPEVEVGSVLTPAEKDEAAWEDARQVGIAGDGHDRFSCHKEHSLLSHVVAFVPDCQKQRAEEEDWCRAQGAAWIGGGASARSGAHLTHGDRKHRAHRSQFGHVLRRWHVDVEDRDSRQLKRLGCRRVAAEGDGLRGLHLS